MYYRKPQLIFVTDLPDPKKFGPSALLIFDQILFSHVPNFRGWIKKFPASYAVQAGESLKDLTRFPQYMEAILKLADQLSTHQLKIIVAGGGSVGDFGGFVASILKRGVDLVQIPTTWLSSIDSAHGGKTALNVGGIKNQIGTYHSASQIFLVQSILFAQGHHQIHDAFGELAKIALIDSNQVWRTLSSAKEKEADLIWKYLPQAITAKYKVVNRDPFEKKGIRQLLNLGHTVGHVIEADRGLSHGASVAQGLLFCLEWSHRRKLLKKTTYEKIHSLFSEPFQFTPLPSTKGFKPIPEKRFIELLKSDKKKQSASHVNYVFIENFGKTPLVSVPIQSIVNEAKIQKWVK